MSDRELTHLDDRGHARMVDVGGKPVTRRQAVAHALLRLSSESAAALAEGRLLAHGCQSGSSLRQTPVGT